MFTNRSRNTTAAADVRDDARQRMLAARDRIRRHFSPDAMAETDRDSTEVAGGDAAAAPPGPSGVR
jgi:hypothetical protein